MLSKQGGKVFNSIILPLIKLHDASKFLIRSRDKVEEMVVDEVGNKISWVDGQVCYSVAMSIRRAVDGLH